MDLLIRPRLFLWRSLARAGTRAFGPPASCVARSASSARLLSPAGGAPVQLDSGLPASSRGGEGRGEGDRYADREQEIGDRRKRGSGGEDVVDKNHRAPIGERAQGAEPSSVVPFRPDPERGSGRHRALLAVEVSRVGLGQRSQRRRYGRGMPIAAQGTDRALGQPQHVIEVPGSDRGCRRRHRDEDDRLGSRPASADHGRERVTERCRQPAPAVLFVSKDACAQGAVVVARTQARRQPRRRRSRTTDRRWLAQLGGAGRTHAATRRTAASTAARQDQIEQGCHDCAHPPSLGATAGHRQHQPSPVDKLWTTGRGSRP